MTPALGSILIGWVAALVFGAIWAAQGVCQPPYTGPRRAPAGQPHITRYRP